MSRRQVADVRPIELESDSVIESDSAAASDTADDAALDMAESVADMDDGAADSDDDEEA